MTWNAEARDRSSISLPGVQSELIERVAAASPHPVAVVVISGARAGKLYLDTKQTPSASDLQSVDVGSLKWPSL